jgi:hypothetical protein
VLAIDLTDRGLDARVEGGQAHVFWIAGLVDGVVAGDPGVGGVAARDLLPEPDCAVLEVEVVPEGGVVGDVVGVPVLVLAAGELGWLGEWVGLVRGV